MPKAKDLLFSPDGRTLALVREDQTIALWDLATRTERCSLPKCVDQNRHIVVFVPDGKALFTYTRDAGVKRWDASTGRETAAFKIQWCWALACSPDGQMLALGEGGHVRLCDAATGRERAVLKSEGTQGVSALVFAPDGKTLAVGMGSPGLHGSVVVWDLESRQLRFTLTPPEGEHFTSAAFSPDGKKLVVGVGLGFAGDQGGTVRSWDTATGQEREKYSGHNYAVVGVRFAPDGKTLVSASAKQGKFRELFAWNVPPAQEWTTVHKTAEWASSSRSSPPTARPSPWAGGTVRSRCSTSPPVRSGPLSADTRNRSGPWSLPPTVKLWPLVRTTRPCGSGTWRTGRECAYLKHEGSDTRLAFSPDGRTLAIANRNKPALRFWDTVTGKDRSTKLANEFGVRCLAYAPDGRTLALGGVRTGVKLWDVEQDREKISFPTRRGTAFGSVGIHSLAFSPDGKRLAAGDEEGLVTIRNLENAAEEWTWKAHLGAVTRPIEQDPNIIGFGATTTYPGPGVLGLAFSPDGKTLATGRGPAPGLGGEVVGPGHRPGVRDLEGESAARRAVCGVRPRGNETLRGQRLAPRLRLRRDPQRSEVMLWEVAAAPERVLVQDRSGIGPLALSPDGRTLVVGCGDDQAQVYDTATGRRRATVPESGYQSVQYVALTPDGNTIVTAGQGQIVTLWDRAGRERMKIEQPKPISAMCLAPDGKTVAVGTWEGVTMWDVATGREQEALVVARPDDHGGVLRSRQPNAGGRRTGRRTLVV